MSIQKLKEVLDEIDYPVLMEIVDSVWSRNGDDEIYWNEDDNMDDLESQDGNTYSAEPFEGSFEYDGFLIVNGNNGCGQTITYMFNLDKEVEFE